MKEDTSYLIRAIHKEIKRTNSYIKGIQKFVQDKNKLEQDIEDIKKDIYKLIKRIEQTEARAVQTNKLTNLNEYDKIILKNLESRISILEEEKEK